MAEDVKDLVLEHLKAIRADVADIKRDVKDLKVRMTSVERQLGSNGASETEHYAAVMGRMDGFDDRLSRVEVRLTLKEA